MATIKDARPYGIKAVRMMKEHNSSSSRQAKKINDTYNYFLEKVDPLIGECITHLLLHQPTDVPQEMLMFLHARKNGLPPTSRADTKSKARKDQKIFLATAIGPIVSKLVNRIAIARPDDVINFMTKEINDMILVDKHIMTTKPEISPIPKSIKLEPKSIQVAILGNGGAGKSSIINVMQGNFDSGVKPTVGFRPITMLLGDDFRIKFYDLGGGKRIRDVWDQYMHDVHALIYVVDASETDEECADSVALYNKTVNHPLLQGKPLLIYANKQDKPDSLRSFQISTRFGIPLGDRHTHLAECTTTSVTPCEEGDCAAGDPTTSEQQDNNTADPRIESALEWLVESIKGQYQGLNERVLADTHKKTLEETRRRLERERKVLKNKIAAAFASQIDPAVYSSDVPVNPEDLLTADEGMTFLASELGEDVAGMAPIVHKVAACAGYQRLALQIIGSLKSPISKKKTPMDWPEIMALLVDIRAELGLPVE